MTEVRPFSVEISRAAIDDLRERLARTRWPEKEPVGDWSMGIPLAYVQELASYWAESYDMRRVADRNRWEQQRLVEAVGRRVETDAKTETENGDSREALGVPEPTEGVANVLKQHD